MRCFRCGDKGTTEGCKTCGRKIEITVKDVNNTSNTKLKIWDSSILKNDNKEIQNDNNFKQYTFLMDKIFENSVNGIVGSKSLMFISPRGMGKHTFINSIFSQLEHNGLSTYRIVDHNEYLRNVLLATERPFRKHAIDLDEFLNADLVCISVDYDNRWSALRAIRSVLEKRGNIGKPTYIISDFPISALESGNFRQDIDIRYKEQRDELRYCRVISTY